MNKPPERSHNPVMHTVADERSSVDVYMKQCNCHDHSRAHVVLAIMHDHVHYWSKHTPSLLPCWSMRLPLYLLLCPPLSIYVLPHVMLCISFIYFIIVVSSVSHLLV
ncbi:uncharacterized protein BYT42DRAFT_245359 [Radiomyces spectabilis]|uniref:uncharacterized protein n=1 Tax=Radiomyces spectabilis TaxID=64574 RepID=UPI002221075F|nr:uncharacterized protein BYT42DRAFT_245359 [Radiomyces spectabilis]KAI8388745.1 hypothetical protein BYT42DRAFT_245359 [Radiomyces spectabilis]